MPAVLVDLVEALVVLAEALAVSVDLIHSPFLIH